MRDRLFYWKGLAVAICGLWMHAACAQAGDIGVLFTHPDMTVRELANRVRDIPMGDTALLTQYELLLRDMERRSDSPAERAVIALIQYRLNIERQRTDDAFLDVRNAVIHAEELPPDDYVRGLAFADFGYYLHDYHVNELAPHYLKHGIRILSPRDSRDTLFTTLIWRRLIRSYEMTGQHDSTLHYYNLAIGYFAGFGPTDYLGDLYNYKGLYLHDRGDYINALDAFQAGIEVHKQTGTSGAPVRRANTEESMAHTLISLGRTQEGFDLLEKALHLRLALNRNDAIRAWTYLMQYALTSGKPDQAFQYYITYLDSLPGIRALGPEGEFAYPVIADVLAAVGHSDQARVMEDRGNEIRLARLEVENERLKGRTHLNAYTRYRNQVFEQQLAINTLENTQLRQSLKLKSRTLIGLAIIAILIAIATWYFLRTKAQLAQRDVREERQKRRILNLENENLRYTVELKERDLSRVAADNKLRTALKKEIVKKLRCLENEPDGRLRKALFLLVRELDQTLVSEDKMNLIQANIKSINAAFEDSLRTSVPGITQSEVELCSLIRLGMNNHDIANMLNKANSTIRVYKTRIKDKAGVGSVSELEDMLRTM